MLPIASQRYMVAVLGRHLLDLVLNYSKEKKMVKLGFN